MINSICKVFLCVMVASSLTLCSCHNVKTENDNITSEDRIKHGYELANSYIESNYEWVVDEYSIQYRFIYDGHLVYQVTHRDDLCDDVLGEGKSISILLNPETFEVVQILKSQ